MLNEELRQHSAKCIGFVILPDYVHAIVWLPEVGKLSQFMHGGNRKTSFHIRKWYRRQSPNYFEGFGEGDRFWQPKYYLFEIYTKAKLPEKLNYIHAYPVRKGLATQTTDWKRSSARWYEWQKSIGVPIEWVA